MSTDFKYTGHPEPANTSNIQGSGVIIPSPGVGKVIGILDILATAPCELRENDEDGYLIAYIPQGSTRLDSCINAGMGADGEGNAVYCMANPNTKCTFIYASIRVGEVGGGCEKWTTAPPRTKDCEPVAGGCCEKVETRLGFASEREALADAHENNRVPGGEGSRIGGMCGAKWPGLFDGCDELQVGLGPGTLCFNSWCYVPFLRGPLGFLRVAWGYSLCKKIPGRCGSSSSSSSGSGYSY